MKSFTTLVLVVAIAAATVVLGLSDEDVYKCKAKVGASDADVTEFKSNVIPTTRGSACLLACLQKNAGMIDKDNKMVVSVMKKHLETVKQTNEVLFNKFAKIIDDCKAEEKPTSDVCESAKSFNACFARKRKAAGIRV